MGYRPGIEASKIKRMERSAAYYDSLRPAIESLITQYRRWHRIGRPSVVQIKDALIDAGYLAPKGGPLTYYIVAKAVARIGEFEPPASTYKMSEEENRRRRIEEARLFR